MSYISDNLLPGESVVYTGKVSKFIFVSNAIEFVVGVALILLFMDVAGIQLIGGVLVLHAIWRVVRKLIYMWTTEFCITNRRCVLKRGLVSILVSDISLDKCEGVSFSQPVLGRMFGYGTLGATTGGQTQAFPGLENPSAFRNELFKKMEEYKGTTGNNSEK